jgi:hypothetical protein
MTPEQRAAKLLHDAAEQNLTDGYTRTETAKWHALIAVAITEALREARDRCQFIPDRIAIGELMVGELPESKLIDCFVCGGIGTLGSVTCQGCNGAGVIADSGPMPDPAPGVLFLKPCGCAVDWFGLGSPPEYQTRRRQLWAARGFSERPEDASVALPLITQGAGCSHDRRETRREVIGEPDLRDLPPGSGA